jgi:hypothetical protein
MTFKEAGLSVKINSIFFEPFSQRTCVDAMQMGNAVGGLLQQLELLRPGQLLAPLSDEVLQRGIAQFQRNVVEVSIRFLNGRQKACLSLSLLIAISLIPSIDDLPSKSSGQHWDGSHSGADASLPARFVGVGRG